MTVLQSVISIGLRWAVSEKGVLTTNKLTLGILWLLSEEKVLFLKFLSHVFGVQLYKFSRYITL